MDDEFHLTDAHLKLLARLWPTERLSECEVGAPEFDGKRPYGNSSHLIDIVEIVHGFGATVDNDGCQSLDAIRPDLLEEAERLHAEMPVAFAVAWSMFVRSELDSIEPSLYSRANFREGWVRS
ncbi:MAG TPA: hypothetical protein VMW08_00770 [Acidimicrobiales bacterium]|nr:hypothetical protein [Acidimicrobiales bacterium]